MGFSRKKVSIELTMQRNYKSYKIQVFNTGLLQKPEKIKLKNGVRKRKTISTGVL